MTTDSSLTGKEGTRHGLVGPWLDRYPLSRTLPLKMPKWIQVKLLREFCDFFEWLCVYLPIIKICNDIIYYFKQKVLFPMKQSLKKYHLNCPKSALVNPCPRYKSSWTGCWFMYCPGFGPWDHWDHCPGGPWFIPIFIPMFIPGFIPWFIGYWNWFWDGGRGFFPTND